MGRDKDDLRNAPGKNRPYNGAKSKADDGNAKRRVNREKSNDTADWGGVDPAIIAAAISKVTVGGGALRFGYTSDGGAYAIGIYGDGTPYTEYLRPDENVGAFLEDLIDAWS